MTETSLTIRSVSKVFAGPQGDVVAVDGVSLDAASGEFLVLHGASGCGKSTLLMIAGALLAPDSGEVTLSGEDPYALSARTRSGFRARRVGFVFQQFHLVPYLSVLDNVRVPQLARDLPNAAERSVELLAEFQLEHRAQHVPSELSVGEQQRVSLARALLGGPQLILADEPTGNLDDENARIVLDALARSAEQGCIVLMVTHEARSRERATRSLCMNSGRIEG